MCARSIYLLAWARYASDFAAILQDCLFASMFKTASSLVFASLSTIRRNCAALGPVDARQSRNDPRAPRPA